MIDEFDIGITMDTFKKELEGQIRKSIILEAQFSDARIGYTSKAILYEDVVSNQLVMKYGWQVLGQSVMFCDKAVSHEDLVHMGMYETIVKTLKEELEVYLSKIFSRDFVPEITK